MAIVKHNKLIETSYKLNSREQFFILFLISQISQTDRHFREYTMTYGEIESILNFDGKRRIANRAEVFGLMDKLNSEPILYEKGNIIGKSVWLQHMEHNKDTDEFTFSLSEKLREYLMQLKEHFTRYNIQNIIYLSGHSIRLYELLKRYQYLDTCEITIDKLKFYLGIEEKYTKFYEFKRWVLLPTQAELEKYTDIKFEFSPTVKSGKKVLSLTFEIFENRPKYSPEVLRLLNTVETYQEGLLKTSTEPDRKADTSLLKEQRANSRIVEQSIYADLLETLGPGPTRAFEFLASKGVNKTFIIEQVLKHKNLQHEVVRGFEDHYVLQAWNFLERKSQANSKAAAFVTWWKKGKLSRPSLHASLVESIHLQRKKDMRNDDKDTASMQHMRSQSKGHSNANLPGLFDRSENAGKSLAMTFRSKHPKSYQRLKQQAIDEVAESLNQPRDRVKVSSQFAAAINSRLTSLIEAEMKDSLALSAV